MSIGSSRRSTAKRTKRNGLLVRITMNIMCILKLRIGKLTSIDTIMMMFLGAWLSVKMANWWLDIQEHSSVGILGLVGLVGPTMVMTVVLFGYIFSIIYFCAMLHNEIGNKDGEGPVSVIKKMFPIFGFLLFLMTLEAVVRMLLLDPDSWYVYIVAQTLPPIGIWVILLLAWRFAFEAFERPSQHQATSVQIVSPPYVETIRKILLP